MLAQAPHPDAAASMARSELSLGTRMSLPSGALPVETDTVPPEEMMRSKAPRSTIRPQNWKRCRAPGPQIEFFSILEMLQAGWAATVSWEEGRAQRR